MGSVDPTFTGNLSRILVPALEDAGFRFDGRRVLRLAENDAGAYRSAAPSAPGLYVVRAGGTSRKLVVLAGR